MKSFNQLILQYLSSLPVRQRGRVIIAIPITCLFVALAAFAWLKISLIEDDVQIQQAQNVQIETKQLLTALLNAEVAMQGYGLTQQAKFLQDYQRAIAPINDAFEDLRPLIQDNPEQIARLEEIRVSTRQTLALMQQRLVMQRDADTSTGQPSLIMPTPSLDLWLEQGKLTFNETYARIDQFAQAEERSLEDRKQHQEAYRKLTWTMLCLLALVGTGGCPLAMHLFHQMKRELADQQINLRKTNQQLEQACEQLQRFTADASHELRAPLAAVLSNAQVALVEFDDEPDVSRDRVKKIVELTKSMSILVGHPLFLPRQEVTFKSEVFQPIDLVELLQQVVEAWKFQIDAQKHDFQHQFPDALVRIDAEPNLLKQAIAFQVISWCFYR